MTIKYKDQIILFALVTLVGIGVVITAIQTPPSRFDPLGSQKIMLFIGVLVTLFSLACTLRAIKQWKAGVPPDDSEKSRAGLTIGMAFVLFPTLLSIAIVESLLVTELVLAVIFFLTGLLVIKTSPDDSFSGKTIAYLGVSGLILIIGVTQLFKHVLGLPLP